ncbi:uncharacterized protein LOC120629097 [Pararge aegeria]|uniref:Jg1419 protein n=2 Tax=Pararge aegeria TaxID=116150 RepID=A0A8S4RNZ3_9NEOP|nr:uncharacterized protein LOC120629097 [Pararge aegeria]CAH2238613.1 jg1419 [Pararge aegeria aegeria]
MVQTAQIIGENQPSLLSPNTDPISVQMAEPTEEMPLIAIEPEKMLNSWKGTIKLCALIALCCVVYSYLHISIKTFLIKSKRLEKIGVMVVATEKMLQNLYDLDQNLAGDLEELNDFYLDY